MPGTTDLMIDIVEDEVGEEVEIEAMEETEEGTDPEIVEIVETDPEVETEDEIVTGAETEEETGTGVETEEGETGVTQETTGDAVTVPTDLTIRADHRR